MAVLPPGIRLNVCDWIATALSRSSSGQSGVTPIFVVIGFVVIELPFKIALVPEKDPIELFAPHGSDQSFTESMRTGAYTKWL